ncbi:beta-ketoacyl reductase, partial [Streptomyces europaeiscabiei]
ELAGTLGIEDGLETVIPALAAWRNTRRQQGRIDGWRYRVEWHALPAPARAATGGTWLLAVPAPLADDESVTETVAALEARGARAAVVIVDADHLSRAGLGALLTPAAESVGAFTGVLSLLALDERPHPQWAAVPLGLAATLTLVQALGDTGIEAPLWCVTRGAVGCGRDGAPTAPAQAGVWGLGRAAALEHPKRWGGLVDLPATGPDRGVDLLLDVIAAGTQEDQVALRGGTAYGRRLVHAATGGKAAARDWRPRGTVLVTGGTGAL